MKILPSAVLLALALPASAATPPLTFGAWISEWHPDVSLLRANPDAFDSVSFCWFAVGKDGSLRRSAPPDRDGIVEWARRQGIKTYLTVGGGKPDLPAGITGRAADRCLSGLAAACEKYGFDGVDVDIEGLDKTARKSYTGFITMLARRLHGMKRPRLLSVTVQECADAEGEAGSCFDYAALGKLGDCVRVMHYDYNYDEPGAIEPREQFASAVAFARSRIPAEKYVPAAPWYGRDWNVTDQTHMDILWRMTEDADGISGMDELVRKYGGAPEWREPEGELSYTYTAGGKRHEVWMADPKQFEWMVDEARKAGVAGIYAWQLEYAAPGFIPAVRRKVLGREGPSAPRDPGSPPSADMVPSGNPGL